MTVTLTYHRQSHHPDFSQDLKGSRLSVIIVHANLNNIFQVSLVKKNVHTARGTGRSGKGVEVDI